MNTLIEIHIFCFPLLLLRVKRKLINGMCRFLPVEWYRHSFFNQGGICVERNCRVVLERQTGANAGYRPDYGDVRVAVSAGGFAVYLQYVADLDGGSLHFCRGVVGVYRGFARRRQAEASQD